MNNEGILKASVIICTYNRANLLKRLLQCLEQQTMPAHAYEIVLIDDASRDDTGEVCHSFQDRLPNMKYIKLPENRGKAQALKYGISQSQGEQLIFTDDDCLPSPTWVENMIQMLDDHPIVAGKISSKSRYLTRAQNISEFHPFMAQSTTTRVHFLAGANMGIQRKVLEEIGDFAATQFAFDMIIALKAARLNYPIYYSPDIQLIHDPLPKSWSGIWDYEARRSFRTIQLRNEYQDVLLTPFFLRSSLAVLILSPFLSLGKAIQIFLGNPGLWSQIDAFPVVVYMKMAWCWGAFRGLRSMGK